MQIHYALLLLFACAVSTASAAPADSLDQANRTPVDRSALLRQLQALPCGIQPADSKQVILWKLKMYLAHYSPNPAFSEDRYAKAAVDQALKGVATGGYGIGAVLVDGKGQILHGAYNQQLQTGRSDLHGEMALLTEFESLPQFRKYRSNGNFTGSGTTIYTEQLKLYTSAEPCPMCFVRVAIAGVDTRYVTTGPDDGMNARAQCLPPFWYQLSQKHKVEAAQTAPVLRQLAHCLFYSFML
jgi:tRNA(Arg) A34 adenosine deaminase TadA